MRSKYRAHPIFKVILLAICLAGLLTGNSWADEDSKYLDAVREFADNVLKHGRDTYGPKHTPLFVDGLNIHTHEPVKWIAPNGDRWILSNLASQQTLMRTLDGLSVITGNPKYRQAAMDAIKYAFENLRHPNGLFYWGHATAYDAKADDICGARKTGGEDIHALKLDYPYYELMWEVDPEATKKFIESFWSAHIIDWSNLDFSRFALPHEQLEEPWNHEYDQKGSIFFKGKGHGQFSTGSSLIQAGTTLYNLSEQEQALIWSRRLAKRYVDTRHPKTGISAFLYNGNWHRPGTELKEHFVDPHTDLFPYDFFEQRAFYYPEKTHAHPWVSFLLVGEMLEEKGKEFTQWALEELTTWGKVSYRRKDNVFIPMLTDGTSLEGYVFKQHNALCPKGTVVQLYTADLVFFWAYTLAYRTTGDRFMWKMARDIGLGNGLGDIGENPKHKPKLCVDTNCSDVFGLIGLLELYNKTSNPELLQIARRIGDNILQDHSFKGFFVTSKKHIYTRLDCFEPLALLHLVATMKSESVSVPRVWPSCPLFVPPYRYKQKPTDRQIIYSLTDSLAPPMSLQEAAAIGDVNMVSSLLEKGADVDGREDQPFKTALHRAAISGHKNVAVLLLTKEAGVNARDSGCRTPLHYAAEKGHKDIAELLVAQGADVNVKDKYGRTPVDVALSRNRKELVELLRKHGAKE
ncbi:MAG: ankyrin repeat domain-containing protein [Planctomycetota bacterium]|jgi:pectate lyase